MLLLGVLDRIHLVDSGSEIVGIPTKRNLQRLEKLVHSSEQRLRSVGLSFDRRRALEDDDPRDVGS